MAGRVTIFSEAGERMQEVTGEAAFNSLGSSIKYLNLKVDALTRLVFHLSHITIDNDNNQGSVSCWTDVL